MGGKHAMKDLMLKLYVKAQNLLSSDEGQDLVEYALVLALVALGATAGMKTLASDISAAFSTVGTTLNADI
jgi:pilus assembly protein Flp/PilA